MDTNVQVLSGSGGTETENLSCMSSDIYGLLTREHKMNLVRKITQYQATDGTCFSSEAEAEAYEEMLRNPHFKQLKEKVEQLERTVSHLQHDLLIERTKNPFRDIQINRPPYQQPMFSYEAYNPATGKVEQ